MLSSTHTLGSTDQGTSFSDIIISNVSAVSDGQVTGFQAFLHDPKSLKEMVDQVGKMAVPKRFIEAVTARRVATNSINSTWRCPLNLQTPLTTPIPWSIIEASQNNATNDQIEYQIMRTIDFIGRNYIRLELPEVDTTTIGMKSVNGVIPQPMTDPQQMYLGAWHRDLVPRIIDKVSFYPRSSQHKLFTYTGYDIAVHNIIFGNANKEMNDLMAGEDRFELTYDPYRVDGSALGIASFKGIDTYKQFEIKPAENDEGLKPLNSTQTVTYTGINASSVVKTPLASTVGEHDGFIDSFQLDTTLDEDEFKSFYRRNVWYEAPVAVPYDCRHSIHSRRFFHRKSVIIVPLDVLPFGYSIESSLPTAALAGDCGYVSIQRHSDWFNRAFYLTRLSDVPSLHPLVQHTHLQDDDYVVGKTLTTNGFVDSVGKITATDPRKGWVDPRSIARYGDNSFVRGSIQLPDDVQLPTDQELNDQILAEESTRTPTVNGMIGQNIAGLEGVIPNAQQPIHQTVGGENAFSKTYYPGTGYIGRQVSGGLSMSRIPTSASSKAASRIDYNTSGDPTLDNVFLLTPSNVDLAWYKQHLDGLNIKLLQTGYVTLPSIKALLTKLPNIYITTEWSDYDINLKNQTFQINNDLYIMALLFWFLPTDSNGIQSMRVYPHHKIDTEYPLVAGIHLQNEQAQGKILYSWDMMNLMTPAHMGLSPLLSNMGIVSFTPLMQPNALPYAIYDQNLSGYLQGRFEKGDDQNLYQGYVNMREGTCKCVSIGINGTALVNLSLFRLVF